MHTARIRTTINLNSYLIEHLASPLGQPGVHRLEDGDEVGHEAEPLLHHGQAHLAPHRAGQVALAQQQLDKEK